MTQLEISALAKYVYRCFKCRKVKPLYVGDCCEAMCKTCFVKHLKKCWQCKEDLK